jgi:hypothetical protein
MVLAIKEHEISGDILVEMDVAMLKEIDLTAFGKRVHIFNAIKHLKARIATDGAPISPTLSTVQSFPSPNRSTNPNSPATTNAYNIPLSQEQNVRSLPFIRSR